MVSYCSAIKTFINDSVIPEYIQISNIYMHLTSRADLTRLLFPGADLTGVLFLRGLI